MSFIDRLASIGGGVVKVSFIERKPKRFLAKILLSHPPTKNALSGKMMVELSKAISEVYERKDEVSLVEVVGDGDFFCSGADLTVARDIDGYSMCSFMQETTTRLRDLPCISVSVIRGGAYGGGTELATATDHRVFANDAVWRCVHSHMGISPGWGGGVRLFRLVGRSKALQILSGLKLTAQECATFGIADLVTAPNQDPEVAALNFFETHFDIYPKALAACKKSVIAAEIYGDNDKAMKLELDAFTQVWGGEDNIEALNRSLKALQSKHNHKVQPA